MHAVSPSSENEGNRQLSHAALPFLLLKRPAVQVEQASAPGSEDEPGGHRGTNANEERPVEPQKLPAGHASAAAILADGHTARRGQGTGALRPAAFVKKPAEQLAGAVMPVEAAKVPGGHGSAALRPVESEKAPGGLGLTCDMPAAAATKPTGAACGADRPVAGA